MGCNSGKNVNQERDFTFSMKDQVLTAKLQKCASHYYKNLGSNKIKTENELLKRLQEFGKIYNLPPEFETVVNVQLSEHYREIRPAEGEPITSQEFSEIITKIVDDYFRSEILGKILRFETLMKVPRDNDEIDTIKNTVAVEYLPLNNDNVFQNGFKLGISPKMWELMIKLKSIQNLEDTSDPVAVVQDKQDKGLHANRMTSGINTIDIADFVPLEKDREMLADWNLSVPAIENDLAKSRLVWRMLDRLKLLDEFKIDPKILANFMNDVRVLYVKNRNPFHNYDHAVQVMHASHYMLFDADMKKDLSKLMQLGILIASYCHDVDHTGRTNAFEVEKRSALAMEYNDRSVLENHHASSTFKVLNKTNTNIFKELSRDDNKVMRKLIISCILATDMAVHGSTTKAMQELQEKLKVPAQLNKKSEVSDYTLTEADVQLVTGYLVHAADLAGPAKNFDLAYLWASRVNQEFTNQVNDEKELGLPLTKHMMNLDDPKIMAKNEIGFMKFVIKPLWETVNDHTNWAMKIASDFVEQNIEEWDKKLKEAQEAEDRKLAAEKKDP